MPGMRPTHNRSKTSSPRIPRGSRPVFAVLGAFALAGLLSGVSPSLKAQRSDRLILRGVVFPEVNVEISLPSGLLKRRWTTQGRHHELVLAEVSTATTAATSYELMLYEDDEAYEEEPGLRGFLEELRARLGPEAGALNGPGTEDVIPASTGGLNRRTVRRISNEKAELYFGDQPVAFSEGRALLGEIDSTSGRRVTTTLRLRARSRAAIRSLPKHHILEVRVR